VSFVLPQLRLGGGVLDQPLAVGDGHESILGPCQIVTGAPIPRRSNPQSPNSARSPARMAAISAMLWAPIPDVRSRPSASNGAGVAIAAEITRSASSAAQAIEWGPPPRTAQGVNALVSERVGDRCHAVYARRPRRSVVRDEGHAVLGAEQHDLELAAIGEANLQRRPLVCAHESEATRPVREGREAPAPEGWLLQLDGGAGHLEVGPQLLRLARSAH
jgi:hypothetical protein